VGDGTGLRSEEGKRAKVQQKEILFFSVLGLIAQKKKERTMSGIWAQPC
jgi:hypothetical protein